MLLTLALAVSLQAKSLYGHNFHHPREVHISGLPKGAGGTPISTEEPFVSRDGRFLFFNTGHKEGNKDMHYARRVGKRWVYRGEIGPAINTPKEVQGNPTMDAQGRFYFIDTTASHMARGGIFHPVSGTLDGLYKLDFLPDRDVRLFKQRFTGNMGVEVGPDGRTMYFSRATWDLNLWFPGEILASNILLSERRGNRFVFDESRAKHIMQNVNTDELEYAAGISRDGLEFFFTRLSRESFRKGHPKSKIMRATRPSRNVPFGRPEEILAIGHDDFVEGPALSADERELYYHKHVGKKFRLFKVVR
ncbi:MAG: hypothetical protein ACE5F3_00810 [Mariprofundaceae bacterium]